MPTPVVHDPRQNRHGWWGTIAFVEDQDDSSVARVSLNGDSSGVKHVFVKTKRETHFVAQGTAVELEPLGETVDEVIKRLEKETNATALSLIKGDLQNLDPNQKTKFYEIVAIDDSRTTPLSRMHSLVTEVCFSNDHWLGTAGEIGQKDIEVGRKLPSLKETVPSTTN